MLKDFDDFLWRRIAQPLGDRLHRTHGIPVTLAARELWLAVVVLSAALRLWIWLTRPIPAEVAPLHALADLVVLAAFAFFLRMAGDRHAAYERAPEQAAGRIPRDTSFRLAFRLLHVFIGPLLASLEFKHLLAGQSGLTEYLLTVGGLCCMLCALYADRCAPLPPSAWNLRGRANERSALSTDCVT